MATPLRKQAPWMIIIAVGAALVLLVIFIGFSAMQKASKREYDEGIELNTKEEIAGQVEARNQVIVLYVNTPTKVEKYGLTFTVTNHKLVTDQTVDTSIEVVGDAGTTTLQFTELEQVVAWESYQFRLRTALDNSLQLVVSQLE